MISRSARTDARACSRRSWHSVPLPRSTRRALVDLQIGFTSAQGAGGEANLYGFRTTGTLIGTNVTTAAGYMPAGLTSLLYDTGTTKVTVGTADAAGVQWPEAWEPDTIRFASGGTAYALAYDSIRRARGARRRSAAAIR